MDQDYGNEEAQHHQEMEDGEFDGYDQEDIDMYQ